MMRLFCGLIISLSIVSLNLSYLYAKKSIANEGEDNEIVSEKKNSKSSDIATQINEIQSQQENIYNMLSMLDEKQRKLSKKIDNFSTGKSTVSVSDSSPILDELSSQIELLYQQVKSIDANQKQNISSSPVNISTITAQINEIQAQQDNIYNMLSMLDDNQRKLNSRIDGFSIEKSTIPTVASFDEQQIRQITLKQDEIMAMLTELAENQKEMEKRISAKPAAEEIGNDEVIKPLKRIPKDQELIPSQISLEDVYGQQYIRLKLIEDGQEVELFLDPSYVDMNLDLSKLQQNKQQSQFEKKPQENKTSKEDKKVDKEDMDRMMDYLSDSLSSKGSFSQQAPQATQAPQTSYTYNIAGQPPTSQDYMDEQDEENTRKGKYQYPENFQQQTVDDPKVLDDLYKAQKLFYAKKYNASLNAAQRSLSRQETALGYALEGSIYFTLGDVDLAISSWENALRLNPNMTEVKKALFKYKR